MERPLIAPYPDQEAERVEALRRYELLDTEPEAPFDELVQLAAQICQVPISLISLIDPLRQWFKAKTGVGVCQTSRDIAFCAHAILQRDLFEVPDALGDVRFATNPLVTGEPHIRFYAGVPLIDRDGHALGTLCVIDRVPKRLSAQQKQALMVLARQVVAQFELRLRDRQLATQVAKLAQSDFQRSQFLVAAEQTADGIAFLDEAGRFTYVNRALAAWYGYEPSELIGKSTGPLLRYLDRRDRQHGVRRPQRNRSLAGKNCRVPEGWDTDHDRRLAGALPRTRLPGRVDRLDQPRIRADVNGAGNVGEAREAS